MIINNHMGIKLSLLPGASSCEDCNFLELMRLILPKYLFFSWFLLRPGI